MNGLLSALFQGCYFAAISLTSVSLATLITIGGTPVIVTIAEQVTGRRSLGRAGAVTLGMALAGLGLLVGLPGGGLSESAVLAGAGMSLLSAGGFAAVTLYGRSLVRGLDELTLNGFGFTLGGVALVPLAAAFGEGLGFRPGLASTWLLGRARRRPDCRRLHAVLPWPAERGGEHRGPADADRAAHRRRARRARAR